MAAARQPVIDADENWAGQVKNAIAGNLVFSIAPARFRDWIDAASDEARKALRAKSTTRPNWQPV